MNWDCFSALDKVDSENEVLRSDLVSENPIEKRVERRMIRKQLEEVVFETDHNCEMKMLKLVQLFDKEQRSNSSLEMQRVKSV